MSSATRQSQRIRQKLRNLAPKIKNDMIRANEQNAEDWAALARVLVPQGATGRSRAAIKTTSLGASGVLIDFGPLSKVLEGGTAKRSTKFGANRGAGPSLPFVNPSKKATAAKRRARIRKVVRGAIKDA